LTDTLLDATDDQLISFWRLIMHVSYSLNSHDNTIKHSNLYLVQRKTDLAYSKGLKCRWLSNSNRNLRIGVNPDNPDTNYHL